MSTITRTWVAFAAIGVGLIHLALVIGAPLGLGIVLAVLGLGEFGWGVLTFARDSVPAPRAALVVAIIPVLGWALLLAVATAAENPAIAEALPFLPLGVATAFELFAAAVLGVHLRRADAPPPPPGLARYLLALVTGALVAAALTTAGLAGTQAGRLAAPAGDGPGLFNLPNHGGH